MYYRAMKRGLIVAVVLFTAAFSWAAEPTQKEFAALMNKVTDGLMREKIEALNDLTTLPGNFAAPALLTFFKQNYNLNGATPFNKAVGVKCAHLLETTPGCDEYMIKLLKNTDENLPGSIFYQQMSTVKCMFILNNKFAVRILSNGLNDNEVGGRVANAYALMNLPDAPYTLKQDQPPAKSADIAKWKAWWETHKDRYAE